MAGGEKLVWSRRHTRRPSLTQTVGVARVATTTGCGLVAVWSRNYIGVCLCDHGEGRPLVGENRTHHNRWGWERVTGVGQRLARLMQFIGV